MGIRVRCPNGHALNVKAELAGKRGICPECGAQFPIAAWAELTTVPSDTLPSQTPSPSPVTQDAEPSTSDAVPELMIAQRPASPVARSIRQRVRRQKQFTLTLGLAVLVIILGAILAWIILHQSG